MQRVLPGEKILMAGTGPLQLVVASQIINANGHVEAFVEAGNITSWIDLAQAAWGNWDLMLDGWHYWRSIRKAGIPLLRNHMILEARGDSRVEEALIAEVDKDWRPKAGTERTLKVDTICLGYGLVPSAEITQLADCEHCYEPRLGGWIPVRQENLETSVSGIYAVGDGSGVAGSQVAMAEGRIAGISAAHSLGYISADEARKRKKPIEKLLKRLKRFRKFMDDISAPRPGLFELARDDTIICRCEEITLEEVKAALAQGGSDINEIKRMTRTGMGRCQGRMCGPTLFEIIKKQLGPDAVDPGYLRPRPPFKPIKLDVLAKHEESE